MLRAPCADIRYVAVPSANAVSRPGGALELRGSPRAYTSVSEALERTHLHPEQATVVAVRKNQRLDQVMGPDDYSAGNARDMAFYVDGEGKVVWRKDAKADDLEAEWNDRVAEIDREIDQLIISARTQSRLGLAANNALSRLDELLGRRTRHAQALFQIVEPAGRRWHGMGRRSDYIAAQEDLVRAQRLESYYESVNNRAEADAWGAKQTEFQATLDEAIRLDDLHAQGKLPAELDHIPMGRGLDRIVKSIMNATDQFPYWRIMNRELEKSGLDSALDAEAMDFAQDLVGTPGMRTTQSMEQGVPSRVSVVHQSRREYWGPMDGLQRTFRDAYLEYIGVDPKETGFLKGLAIRGRNALPNANKVSYRQFMEKVGLAYITKQGDPALMKAVRSIRKVMAERRADIETNPNLLRSSHNLQRKKDNLTTFLGRFDAAIGRAADVNIGRKTTGKPDQKVTQMSALKKAVLRERMPLVKAAYLRAVEVLDIKDPVPIEAIQRWVVSLNARQWKMNELMLKQLRKQTLDLLQSLNAGERASLPDNYWHRVYRHAVIADNKELFIRRLFDYYAGEFPGISRNLIDVRSRQAIESILSMPDDSHTAGKAYLNAQISNIEFKIDKTKDPVMKRRLELEKRFYQERLDSDDLFDGGGFPAPFMERTLDVPDHVLVGTDGPALSMIELDPEIVMTRYLERIAPRIEIARRFAGDPTANEYISGYVRKAIDDLDERGLTGDAFEAAFQAIKDQHSHMRALLEKTLGIYETPKDASTVPVRTMRALMGWSVLTDLGYATFSAVGDTAGLIASIGLTDLTKSVMTAARFKNWATFKAIKRDMHAIGVTAEMAVAVRGHLLADMSGHYTGHTQVERWINRNVPRMFVLNGLAPWTDLARVFSGLNTMNSILRLSERVLLGKASSKQIAELARLGLSRDQAIAITEVWHKQGRTTMDGVNYLSVNDIPDTKLRRHLSGALSAEVDNMVIVPNAADRPNIFANPYAKFLLMYKGFGISATQRLGFAALQRRDRAVFNALMAGTAIMWLATWLRSEKFREMDLQEQMFDSVMRNPLLGVTQDIDNTLFQLSQGHFGLRALMTDDKALPTAGARFSQLTGAPAQILWDAGDAFFGDAGLNLDTLHRNTPYMGLPYIDMLTSGVRQGTREAEKFDDSEIFYRSK